MRLLERLDRVYEIGDRPGADRLAYTRAEDEAHGLFEQWLREAGLAVTQDAAGNTYGRLPGFQLDLGEVWTGSHLDSVPAGGRFDGPLGVLAGLEAVERLGRQERSLVVVAFRGEEAGCLGSRARVAEAALPSAYVELHVEQGPVLARAGAPLGVVTSIVGYVRGELVLDGRAGHAGTTPMDARDDALVAAAHEVIRLRDVALGIRGAVVTVGQLDVEPGGVNVIPARVRLSVDARAPDRERLDALVAAIGLEPPYLVEPATMHELPRRALLDELAAQGLPTVELPSGAGHDAGVLAAAGVPSAMLFVRSLNGGVSHSPDEHSSPEDITVAVGVLTGALGRLAGP